jgi:hypothetical protein
VFHPLLQQGLVKQGILPVPAMQSALTGTDN